MAIIDDVPGVKVEIVMKGEAIKEYDNPDSETEERTVTRYVEAVSGEIFEVKVTLLPDFEYVGDSIRFAFFANGARMQQTRLDQENGGRVLRSEGYRDPDGQVHKYRFTSVETVSHDKAKASEQEVTKEFGTITVQCFHINVVKKWKMTVPQPKKAASRSTPISGESEGESNSGDASRDPKVQRVSEKALKGSSISHSIDFAKPDEKITKSRRPTPTSFRPGSIKLTDPTPTRTLSTTIQLVSDTLSPAATFVFCYRSFDALKSSLVIPRTPTPPPVEDRDAGTLSRDEIQEMQKRLQELRSQQEAHIKIKREQAENEDRERAVTGPRAVDTQLEIGENGAVSEKSTAGLAAVEVIEIEDDD